MNECIVYIVYDDDNIASQQLLVFCSYFTKL